MSDWADPMESFQNAFKFGAGIQQIQAQQQAAAAAKKAADDKAAADADRQARLADFNEKLRNGSATTQDFMITAQDRTKDQNDIIQEGFKQLDSAKQKAALKDTSELFAASMSGNKDFLLSMMDNNIKALENSGSTADAQAMRALRQVAESDPLAVAGFLGTTLGRMGTEGKDILDNALKLQREGGQNKQGADIAYIQAQTAKLLAESEAAKKAGGLPPDMVIDKEGDLRKEYYGRQKAYIEADRNLSNIRDSAKDASGAGDVALVTSFMKMLDPGSVVRETEFASARDTAGLLGQLRSMATKVQSGQFLTPEQRASFSRLAEQYMEPVESRKKNDKATFQRIVKNYGLNPENVFEVEDDGKTTEGQAGLSRLKEYLKKNNPGAAAAIDAAGSVADLVLRFPNGVKAYGAPQTRQEVREVDF